MRPAPFAAFFAVALQFIACAQPPATVKAKDPLHCDPDSAHCAMPGTAGAIVGAMEGTAAENTKPITLLYFTDPICSACWGSEPQLRRLKAEYGDAIDIQYHMGGLLPSWEVYNSGGISKPSDVAGHWDEVSPHYRMPIIGDVWLEDPLSSSYPPSIAFKAAELQGPEKALLFLRRLREQVLVEKKNITQWPVMVEAALIAGLDTSRLRADINGAAPALFQADLTLARSLGVRGFPTFIFSNAMGARQVVYGARPYEQLEGALRSIDPVVKAAARPTTLADLYKQQRSWCAEEMAVMLGTTHEEAIMQLKEAEARGELTAIHTRNGSLWRVK